MAELRLSGGALDGFTLHYVSAGRGPAVVLLHGLGGFAESWRRTVEALAPRYTVIAVDLPGFGRSAKPRARYSLGFFANALGGFHDGLGLGSVSLVDRKSTRLNSSHVSISYAVFCLKKKKK